MIYKTASNTSEETNHYNQIIEDISKTILSGKRKGKRVLLITGSGISSMVPSMKEIMFKICSLIDEYADNSKTSNIFQSLLNDYKTADESEKHQMQSRLLTYIQNAYLGKDKYVQSQDIKALATVWQVFVEWLLFGDGDSQNGVINAIPSQNHEYICEIYRKMKAISITTNFDNLLEKSFQTSENVFYPILDTSSFDKYYLSTIDDDSFIEIQSRGDVFWLECTGSKSKICVNKHKQCYVPGRSIEKTEDGKILCSLCKSEAKVYFAFPGTKEKDAEMSVVINGVWKYLANSISYIIVIGNSMDYDPVLVEFLRELTRKNQVPVLYISRYKDNSRVINEIYKKAATKFLFNNYERTRNIWARADQTEDILKDLLSCFDQLEAKQQNVQLSIAQKKSNEKYYKLKLFPLFEERQYEEIEADLRGSNKFPQLFDIKEVKQIRHFSQLGLKTYWLHESGISNVDFNNHHRLKHSVGVMIIASYLYSKISPKQNEQELQFLQLAALFHDLGHLPFSHLLEEVFEEFGWIPAGESTTYNHEQRAKRLIEKLMAENAILQTTMLGIGYSADELQRLINGEFGKGYLDALINSPIDCDKIEYLFSDAIFMHRGTKEDFKVFIEEFSRDLSVNSNDFLVLKKDSTKSFLKLIRMRGEMYDQVYLRSGLRYLEACCKLIIRIFIAYACTSLDVFTAVEDQTIYSEYYNLSDCKIDKIVLFMENCLQNLSDNEVCEIHVLNEMVKKINTNPAISDSMKNTVQFCFNMVRETHGENAISEIETNRVLTYEISSSFDKSSLKHLIKTLYLRFPGIILIDFVESKSSFSFGKREKRKRRSDGTKSATENILIKDITQIKGRSDSEYVCLGDAEIAVNQELKYSNHSYINIYRISDNLFSYMQAEDYVVNELRKEGIIGE